MKIVIGHKNLNLEELFTISYHANQSEVVVDNQIYAELSAQPPQVQSKELQQYPEIPQSLQIRNEHERAIILITLLQLVKLKKNATKQTVDFFVGVLNNNKTFVSKEDNQIFKSLFENAKEQNIFFSEKELFIISNKVHVYHAIYAYEIYKLSSLVNFLDSTLAFSLETLQTHVDYLSEFALTMGKQSLGVNEFKNNMQALTDKSKLLNSQLPNKQLQEQLRLSKVYQLQAALHERVHQGRQMLTNEINSDHGMLFQEKKYKELILIAKEQQNEQIIVLSQQFTQLGYISQELSQLSEQRLRLLKDQKEQDQLMQEESKQQSSDIHQTFNILSSNSLLDSYLNELYEVFTRAKQQELALKQKATEESKDQKKKKQSANTVQFGSGTRKFFEYLMLFETENFEQFELKANILKNMELDKTLEELLEQRNEERRKPKCPKGTRDMTPLQMAIREKAFHIIKQGFKRHGATEIDTPVFELKETLMGKYGEESKLIYDLEDQGGELLSLRYDLTVPFARYVAQYSIDKIKRFHIAKVYRRDNPQMNKGRFREFYQCDFDIAGQYGLMLADSDVLKVLVDILSQLQIGSFVVKINHRKFLDAMVELSGCEKRKFKAICSSVDKLDKEPWEKVREELITMKGLTTEMTDKLEKFVKLVGKPRELLQELKDKEIFKGHQEGEETIKEMELLFDLLDSMNCLQYFSFDFSLARGLDYYTGLIYEAVLTDQNRVGSIAGGGRYDTLVGMFSGKQIPAVGVSIGIERVFSILEEKCKDDVRPTETQVLVGQFGKNLILERVKVLNSLWSIGVKAETMYMENPKPQRQFEFALENRIPLIIWVGEDEIKKGIVKVKSLNKREEFELKIEEITDKILDIIKDGNEVLLPQILAENAGGKEEQKDSKEQRKGGNQQKKDGGKGQQKEGNQQKKEGGKQGQQKKEGKGQQDQIQQKVDDGKEEKKE